MTCRAIIMFFFFNDTATTESYTLSLHDALPIFQAERSGQWTKGKSYDTFGPIGPWLVTSDEVPDPQNLHLWLEDRKSTRLNSSHANISYAVFCLKKNNVKEPQYHLSSRHHHLSR